MARATSMKVFNLACTFGHGFEGWFGSDLEFDAQRERGLLECPICCDRQIEKRPAAPSLHLARKLPAPAVHHETAEPQCLEDVARNDESVQYERLRSAWLTVVHHLRQHSEDVGSGFAEEARRIQRCESRQRSIRGNATVDEAVALIEEGIPVLPLPDLIRNDEPFH